MSRLPYGVAAVTTLLLAIASALRAFDMQKIVKMYAGYPDPLLMLIPLLLAAAAAILLGRSSPTTRTALISTGTMMILGLLPFAVLSATRPDKIVQLAFFLFVALFISFVAQKTQHAWTIGTDPNEGNVLDDVQTARTYAIVGVFILQAFLLPIALATGIAARKLVRETDLDESGSIYRLATQSMWISGIAWVAMFAYCIYLLVMWFQHVHSWRGMA